MFTDKVALTKTTLKTNTQIVNICYRLANQTNEDSLIFVNKALFFSEKSKSRILLDQIAEKNVIVKLKMPEWIYEAERNYRFTIAKLHMKLNEEVEYSKRISIYADLFDIYRAHETLIDSIKTNYPKFAELMYDTKIPEVAEVQNTLPAGTSIRSYMLGDDEIYIFDISQNTFRFDTVNFRPDFAQNFADFKALISDAEKQNYKQALLEKSYGLYRQLFPAHIPLPADTKRLIIIPDDSLALIPFEALLTEQPRPNAKLKDQELLINKYTISYAPSVSMFYKLITEKQSSATKDVIAFAPVFDYLTDASKLNPDSLILSPNDLLYRSLSSNPDYNKPLPNTKKEVRNIIRAVGKTSSAAYMQTAANESFVKSDQLADYKIIHFATHANTNSENPELSRIELAADTLHGEDGFLHVAEIYGLTWDADLVTLSACETGTGKIISGEGVMGLSRAIFYAGSRNVIATLWQVDDTKSSELMTSFYKYYANGQSFPDALRYAKLDMLRNNEHPFTWAGYVLVGQ